MCTLSWSFRRNGYSVFFNRDELNSRALAISPQRQLVHGVEIIAPRDGEKGGSWITVNEYGVLTCLLNLYESPLPESPKPFLSRGSLVMDLAGCESWASSLSILDRKDLREYPPFQLLQFTPGAVMNGLKWSGTHQETHQYDPCELPISGSSFRNDDVAGKRFETFWKIVDPESAGEERLKQLEAFHLSYDADCGASSVNMCRPDAQTMSFSRVDVDEKSIRFRYQTKNSQGFEFDSPIVVSLNRYVTVS